ncbi:hypothetical protein IJ531_02130, partial [bacterium]|nr:hypothetical protein [bacterium]
LSNNCNTACSTSEYCPAGNTGAVSCGSKWTGCTSCNTTACTACGTTGYYLNGTTCSTCPTGCSACSSSSVCSSCSAGYRKNGNSCTACTGATWSSGGTTTTCSTCTGCSACNTSNGQCSSCNAGYRKNGTTCTACTGATYSTGGTTTTCSTCTGCSACTNTNGQCSSCNAGYYKNGTSCTKCTTSQYCPGGTTAATSCSSAITGCTSCSGTTCTACDTSGYTLQNGNCVSTVSTISYGGYTWSKYNAGDTGGPKIPSTVYICTAGSSCPYGGTLPTCWKGQTAQNCTTSNGYSGCNRTVCNFYAAQLICAYNNMNLPTTTQFASVGNATGAASLNFCDNSVNSTVYASCQPSDTNKCKNARDANDNCAVYHIWSNSQCYSAFFQYGIYTASWNYCEPKFAASVRCVK